MKSHGGRVGFRSGRRVLRPRVRLDWGLTAELEDRVLLATLVVDPAGGSGIFTTIQAAVDAANPAGGDTIEVTPATYTEQVTIGKSLTMMGTAPGVVIQSPSTLTPDPVSGLTALVEINNGATVDISDVTVTGPAPAGVILNAGILVVAGATANVTDTTVTLIQNPGALGDQTGNAIEVGATRTDEEPATATITDDILSGYQKNGVLVRGGSTATITGSTITGFGPTTAVVQNGIQVDLGATATITGNTITGNEFLSSTPDPTDGNQATGILINSALPDLPGGPITVSDNTIGGTAAGAGNDLGIASSNPNITVAISGNTLQGNRFEGLVLGDGSATVSNNNISGSNIGVAVIAFMGDTADANATLLGNNITDNGNGGLSVPGGGISVLVQPGATTMALATANFNRIVGNAVGVDNTTAATVDATLNWWGINTGPNTTGGDTTSGDVNTSPWLVLSLSASPTSIEPGGTSAVTASLTNDSSGGSHQSAPFFPDGVPIAFSATGGTMNPASAPTQSGSASSNFTSTTPGPASASVTLDNETLTTPVTVTALALVVAPAPLVIQEGAAIPVGTVVGTFVDNNGVEPTGNFSGTATFTGLAGSPAPALSFTQQGTTNQYTVALAAAVSPADGIDEGTSNFTIDIASTNGVTASATGILIVNDAPLAPNLAQPIVLPATAGTSYTATLFNFTDGDLTAPLSDYTATIDWGDGTPLYSVPAAMITGTPGGPISVAGTHTYTSATAAGSPNTVTITVTDAGGSRVVGQTDVAVDAALLTGQTPVPVVGTEGELLNTIPVEIFTVANPGATAGQYIATIDWGDNTPTTTGVVTSIGASGPGIQLFAVTGSHIYNTTDVSPFPISVTVTDSTDTTNTFTDATGSATISAGAIDVTVLPIVAATNVPTTNPPGTPGGSNQLIATFTDQAGLDPVGNYSATVDWGDGTPLDTTATILALDGSSNQLGVYAVHTYATSGVFRITVTVNDSDPATGIGGNIALVLPPAGTGPTLTPADMGVLTPGEEGIPLPTTINQGVLEMGVELATLQVATAGQPASNFTVQIDWGDGSPQSAGQVLVDSAADGSNPGTSNFFIVGNHTYAEARVDPYLITINVTQNSPGAIFVPSTLTATTNASIVINDAPLTPGVSLPILATRNQPLNNVPVATFVDANPGATAADFSGTIDWGDATTLDTNARFVLIGSSSDPANPGAEFAVYGSHVYTTAGPFSTIVNVTDVDGSSTGAITGASNVTVAQQPIVVSGLPIGTFMISTATPAGLPIATFVETASPDAAAADFTATIDWGDHTPTSTTTDIVALGGGQFEVLAPSHTYTDSGTFPITVTVTDTTLTPPATGVGGNLAIVVNPVLTSTPAPAPIDNPATGQFTLEGEPLTNVTLGTLTTTDTAAVASGFTVQIDWGDGSPQSQGTITGPTGGPFTIAGSHTYTEANPDGYTVKFIVTDAHGSMTSASVRIVVEDALLSDGIGLPIFATEYQALNNIPVATFDDANPFATAGDFTAQIDWGDSPTPGVDGNARVALVGAALDGDGLEFAVFGTHVYTTIPPANLDTEIFVIDKDNSEVTIVGTATVSVTATPLVLTAQPVTGTEGIALPNGQTISTGNVSTGTVVGSFFDTSGPDPIDDYSVLIDWGNGTTLGADTVTPGTIIQNGTNFVILAPATPGIVYSDEGSYTARVALTDSNGGATAYSIIPVTVLDAPLAAGSSQPTIPPQTQDTPSGLIPIAAFTDANPLATPADYTVTIDWGDGSPQSAGAVTQSGQSPTTSGTFTVSGNHTYAEPGSFTLTIDVKDNGGSQLTLTFPVIAQVTVGSSRIVVSPVTFHAVQAQPILNQVVATFTDSEPGPISDYSATINWGDMSSPTINDGQIVELGAGEFEVLGSLPNGYPQVGTFSVIVTVSHNLVALPSVTSTAIVNASPITGTAIPITAVEGMAFTGPIAEFTDTDTDAVATEYSVTVNYGDGTAPVTFAGNTSNIIQPGGLGTTFTVLILPPGHIYKEEGEYTLTVTVTHDTASFTATSTATVSDAPLVPVNPQPTVVIAKNALFAGPVATFQDLNPFGSTADFTATIDWGDGSPNSVGAVLVTGTPNVYQVIGLHVYTQLGTNIGGTPTNPTGQFAITVTIHDVGGSELVIQNTATVSEQPITVGGQLNPSSDSGKFQTDGITNVNQPNFFGTSTPDSDIKLFATPVGGGAPIQIGQTESLSDGSWSITSNRLADGSYAITGTGQDQQGFAVQPQIFNIVAATGTGSNILTIDTVGPRVTNASFDRFNSTVQLTFSDGGGVGLLPQSLQDSANFVFNNQAHRPLGKYIIGAITVSPGSGAGDQTVGLSIVNTFRGTPVPSKLLRGFFQIVAHAESVLIPSGIQDLAGNALDGEFYGPGSASGNGVRGGDFVANFNNFHNITNPPATVIGIPHPNDPPAHFAPKKDGGGHGHKGHVVIHNARHKAPKASSSSSSTSSGGSTGSTSAIDQAIQNLFGF